jgi:thiol:disulfide interchange protein
MSRKKTDKKRFRKAAPQQGISSWLVIGGIALVLAAIYFVNQGQAGASGSASLEAEWQQALAEKRPTFVFLHSADCIPCKVMMDVADEVYPAEFEDRVALIDVDVYDQRNNNLMRAERLQSIPTLVFYDAQGNRNVYIGAMQADQFRQTMSELAAGPLASARTSSSRMRVIEGWT